MSTLASSFIFQAIRMLSVFAFFAFCWPVFAQNQSKAAIEIDTCIRQAKFYTVTFMNAKSSFVANRVKTFISCLSKTSNPKDPEVQYAIGVGYAFAPTSSHIGGYMEKSHAAFCAAAELGYVLAQEKCAAFNFENNNLRYKWTLAAALNGLRSAQADISINAWGNVATKEDQDYNNYLVQYLGCHPAMLESQCSAASDTELDKVCREGMKELAVKRLSEVDQCHKELNNVFFDRSENSKREEWEQRASKQLTETLKNIRQQVKRYPGLAKLQAIDP